MNMKEFRDNVARADRVLGWIQLAKDEGLYVQVAKKDLEKVLDSDIGSVDARMTGVTGQFAGRTTLYIGH